MSRFGKRDLLLIAALLLICAAVFFACRFARPKGGSVVVTVDGGEYGSYRLSEEQTVEIFDREGRVTNVLVIEDGRARMREADCPDQLCVHQRAIDRAGEAIVCLPNRVIAEVERAGEEELDGFVQ